ncbi:MAG: hypothetical protein IMW85_00070 [Thermicanus sp.]|nr:hypothetical protein [Thermicanus sp.]
MPRYGNFQSAVIEGFAIYVLLSFSPLLLPSISFRFSSPTLFVVSFLVTVFEIFLHRRVIRSGIQQF